MKESPYYRAVAEWLEAKQGCFKVSQNKGTRLGRVDVVGARHLGGDLATDYEIVAVEVKTGGSFFSSACQAVGYSVFAHRCYLASYHRGKGDFSRAEYEVAHCLGIGLIKIRSLKTTGIEVRLSAPPRQPPRRFSLQILESMGLSECVLCRGLFEGTYKGGVTRGSDAERIPQLLIKASDKTSEGDKTGLIFWSDEAMYMKKAAGDDGRNTARRYVCPDCITHLLGPLAKRLDNDAEI